MTAPLSSAALGPRLVYRPAEGSKTHRGCAGNGAHGTEFFFLIQLKKQALPTLRAGTTGKGNLCSGTGLPPEGPHSWLHAL